MDYGRLIEGLVPLVVRAGEEILRIDRAGFAVETKSDASPVTAADFAAERILLAGLRDLAPGLPVVSEEAPPEPFAVRRSWRRYWLVDPLDGTKEFVARNGEFTVNVALIEDGRPVLGVVGAPALARVFVGLVPERRAECRDAGGVAALHPRRFDPGRPLVVMASRSHAGARLEGFIDALRPRFGAVERTPMGSSLKLCLVAEGKADLYPRLGPTWEWDIAAAQAVLEAAGGAVLTFGRQPLRYNESESFRNPDFIAVGDPAADWWRLLPNHE